MSFYVSTATFFLLHCDEWDRVVALPRHKFVTGATLLQLVPTQTYSVILCNVFNSLPKLSCKYCNLFSAVAEDLHQNCIKPSGFEEAFIQTVDKHAPVKQRKPCQNPAPFINKELRKAVYKKRQLHNKYNKCKTKSNWENYRQQRNLVTKIKKRSIKTYFFERCIGGPKSKDFWPTIKPFITNKGSHFTKNIILCKKMKS